MFSFLLRLKKILVSQKIAVVFFVCAAVSFAAAPETIEIYDLQQQKMITVSKIEKSDEEWKKFLTPEQFEVLRKKGTEKRFTGYCYLFQKPGIYRCAGCGTDLYASGTKYDSKTGWASFFQPVSEKNVRYEYDDSLKEIRTEVLCARCGGHLGHVFNDGPPPAYLRHCINSASLQFVPETAENAEFSQEKT